ncbi:MAG: hypothetical protein CO184_01370 [Candidatus Zambryskibacteria bacterium CG_4_9_14_3_um_filter_40_16]|uniref:Uncharacterized protein n=1 Tax=Candidatus Zambryskibacteria bacterium CG_4_9_14_3_um_filter_40_16 TaxID=1975111 RepID=A0A2M7WUG0_9BACT|nr:MAG: hypothetical protein CO184_01370 [Candidatus Zambryskibacteria bacterium CG_4_9_14_3_um_filter_40_16]
MLYDTLENLRNKPEAHRKKVAFVSSLFVTAVIFSIWVSVLLPRSQSRIIAQRQESVKVAKENSPIDTVRRGAAQAYQSVRGIFSGSQTVNLEDQYQKIKNQVETGQIKLTPEQNQ